MTIDNDDQLTKLRTVGRVVARTMAAMAEALEPGITTRELDAIGRRLLERDGARSAPELDYGFPGATCISIFPDIAHGIPGDRALQPGDLVNIDVSAEIDGFYADTGGSFAIPPVRPEVDRLARDGRRALWRGIRSVKVGAGLNEIGRRIQAFADRNGYTIIRNLASHGVGTALHEEPKVIPTWHEPGESRRITKGLVFTIEPFLSLGSEWAVDTGDGWTLRADRARPTVQYEHTLVATSRGPVVVTIPH
ncbi:MAG: type I methionyl aminopeptidase [Proteobacteria bacterium]|nr:type I methionyl aminopeptidase [Pseudomonadota bacterium]MBI3499524.1 type I methionyl aminopeptidase [Pseudomonadota bacterium]